MPIPALRKNKAASPGKFPGFCRQGRKWPGFIFCRDFGAGKTTFARKLAAETGAEVLCPDAYCLSCFSPEEYEKDWEKCFSRAVSLLWKQAEAAVQSGKDVILDMGFWDRKSRDEARRKIAEMGAEAILYYLYAPDEILKKRISERKGAVAENNRRHFDDLRRKFEEPQVDEVFVRIENY